MSKIDYASLIKVNRLYQGINAVALSQKTGIEKTYLNRVEHAQQKLDSERLIPLLEGLNIHYVYVEKYYDSFQKECEAIQHDIIYASRTEVISKKIQALKKKMERHFVTVDLLLLSYSFYISLNQNYGVICQYEKILAKCVDLMNDRQKRLFFLYCATHASDLRNVERAHQLLQTARKIGGQDDLSGMIARVEMVNLYLSNRLLEAYQCNQKARMYFAKDNNYYRLAQCSALEGNIYFFLWRYEQAIQLYQDVIERMKQLNGGVDDYAFCYLNIHLCFIAQQKYKEAEAFYSEWDEELRDFLLKNDTFLMHLAIMYLKLNNKYMCNECIKKFKTKEKHTRIQTLLMKYVESKNDAFEIELLDLLKEAVSLCRKEKNYSDWNLLVNLYWEECDRNNAEALNFLVENLMKIRQ